MAEDTPPAGGEQTAVRRSNRIKRLQERARQNGQAPDQNQNTRNASSRTPRSRSIRSQQNNANSALPTRRRRNRPPTAGVVGRRTRRDRSETDQSPAPASSPTPNENDAYLGYEIDPLIRLRTRPRRRTRRRVRVQRSPSSDSLGPIVTDDMDLETRRRVRARRVASFHQRLRQQRRQRVVPRAAPLRLPLGTEAAREERRHEMVIEEARAQIASADRLLARREVVERRERRWQQQLERADQLVRDAESGNVDLSGAIGLPADLVAEEQRRQINDYVNRAQIIRSTVERERRNATPTLFISSDEEEAIDTDFRRLERQVSEITTAIDISSDSSDSGSDVPDPWENLAAHVRGAETATNAVRDVVVRVERMSFSNNAVQNRGNQGREAQQPRQSLIPRRSNRIRRGQEQPSQNDPVISAGVTPPRPPAARRHRIFANFPDFGDFDYRPGRETPQQPSVERVREIMNESDRDRGQTRGENFLERLSAIRREHPFRPTARISTASRSQRYDPWRSLARANRPPTARRRIQAAREETQARDNRQLPGHAYLDAMSGLRERIGPTSLPSYNAWLDAHRTPPQQLERRRQPAANAANFEDFLQPQNPENRDAGEDGAGLVNVRQLQFWSDLVQFDLLNIGNHHAGLTKSQVERLPRRKFRQTRSTMHESCHICLNDFENGQELYRLTTCKHDFHTACLQPWVEKHKTCPVCRQDIVVSGASGRPQVRQIIPNEPIFL